MQAILDDDIAGMVGRFISGEPVDEETMAVALIGEVGPIPGHYLSRPHTRRWWRQGQHISRSADTLSYPEWMAGGKRSVLDRARDRMAEILRSPEARFLTPGQEADLEKIMREAQTYYRDRERTQSPITLPGRPPAQRAEISLKHRSEEAIMQYRKLGRTGLEVSEIGFGAWGIGGGWWAGANDEESLKSMRTALELGVNFFDTAPNYGDGRSEQLVGKAIRGWSGQAYMATKVNPMNFKWPAAPGHAHGRGVPDTNGSFRVHREEPEAAWVWSASTCSCCTCGWTSGPTRRVEGGHASQLKRQGKVRADSAFR